MKELPVPETYEEGLAYWPYRSSLEKVLNYIVQKVPQNGTLLDVMCGPGYLLGKIKEVRPDLVLHGVDIDERYIPYGHRTYPGISFEQGDVLSWKPQKLFDVVICTGSVHHIAYEHQEKAIANISAMAKQGALVIISDCYIDYYANEKERKLAAARLGYEYIRETIENCGSDKVVEWTIDILWNDVLMQEFKPSFEKRVPLLEKYFAETNTVKSWPNATPPGYGDYIHFCRAK
jgi:SAM-dependent methyltransferase